MVNIKSSVKNSNKGKNNENLEIVRIRSMLENAPTNIMFADRNFKIQYLNPASARTLKGLEQYLPVKVEQMIGSSIDIFHKNPAHQRGILADPKNLPHRAVIQVGPEKLDLLVSAIYDQKGNYLGPMVTWEVVTQKIKIETEMARMLSMNENSPINIMFADRDFKIRYLNPASVRTLKTLEKYLPVKVEQIIGSSIDVFHKNPAHQRGILGDPKNLPHRAVIQVGPEKLDLLVSAIYDQQQNYLGAMVTWEVVTENHAAEEEVKRLVKAGIEGRLDERADLQRFSGSFRDLLSGINELLDLIIAPNKEVRRLIQAATAGRLDERADMQQFNGAFRELVGGVNEMLSAVVAPMKEGSIVLEALAKGDLTRRVGVSIRATSS